MKKLMLVLTICTMAVLLSSQSVFTLPNPYAQSGLSSTLFNPYKLKMTHTMGFTAGGSSNGQGFYESRYTNHIKYEFSPKLELGVDLNFLNFGSASYNKNFEFSSNNDNKSKVLPEFSLKWKPSDAFSMQIEYRSYDPYRSLFEKELRRAE